MATSPLTIQPGTFGEPTPAEWAGMTPEQRAWYWQMKTQQYRADHPEELWDTPTPPTPEEKQFDDPRTNQWFPMPASNTGPVPAAAPGEVIPGVPSIGPDAVTPALANGGRQGLGRVLPWLGDKAKSLVTNPSNAMDLAGVITALVGARNGGNGQASADAQRLNAITEQRMRRVDPLHQAITQLAWGRLPVNSRQGIAPPTYKPLP